jgi:phosphoenolpyruvate carboxykinase (GTP)
MVPGQSSVGDDIAYLRIDGRGIARAVNIEQGIFGIIEDVNPIDDPLIFKALTTPRELIFSNVLINENAPYWLGMGKPLPKSGVNYFGNWEEGLKDKDGNAVLAAHKNARYTIRIGELDNADPLVNDPFGVPISGFIYGSRDSDTSPPVVQSLGWAHGVFIGACLESETTAATIGKIGERQHNPMANFDFLTVPLGLYIRNHLRFGECLDNQPLVFSTNYFLKKDGKFLNEKVDKKVWLMWMEGRVHEEFRAIETPIGFIPLYGDLEALFMQVFGKGYPRESYIEQFSIRASKLLDKLDRIEEIYTEEEDIPEVFKNHLEHQRARLKDAVSKFGKDVISPFDFKG